jgi:DNA-binding beta-propeller fold protein YncE
MVKAWRLLKSMYRLKSSILIKYKKYILKTSLFLGVLLSTVVLSNGLHVYASSISYSASSVLGQSSYTATATTTFNNPGSTAVDSIHHLLFVADVDNNRILVFKLNNDGSLESTTPSYVLGQSNLTNTGSGYSANQLNEPNGLLFDSVNDRLFVANLGSSIYVYDLANGITTNMAASYEVGQATPFTSQTCQTDKYTDCGSYGGLALDPVNNLLFTTDNGNDRVLVFNVNPTTISSGESASHVIGQTNFTTVNTAVSQNSFGYIDSTGLAYDSSAHYLFVGDPSGNRVLVFNLTNGISDGMDASYILGQTSYSATGSNLSQNGFDYDTAVTYDSVNNRLLVNDASNCRIMIFNLSSGISNNMNASAVIGAPSFTSSNCGTTQTQFYYPYNYNMAIDPSTETLYFPDMDDNRVLVYNLVHMTTTSLASAQSGASYNQTIQTTGSQGIVTFSVLSGNLPPGLSLNSSTGAITGTPTTPGSYTFDIGATDSNSGFGSISEDPAYTINVANGTPGVSAPSTGYGQISNGTPLVRNLFTISFITIFVGLLISFKQRSRTN